ncbi:Vir superfamily protein [Cryptosporidium ryanae]|uniref:Vir superfamily protein n=1 Tax=Cryptosporidium ryanae TaxID=515981 RepID=UPI00351A2F42|nr:Vir superfamily protein [Cryptosporidium ryanae]
MKDRKLNSNMVTDKRFDSKRDPRFKPFFLKGSKIKVDKRFSRMFTDEDFSVISSKDPFGNRIIKKKDKEFNLMYEEDEFNIKEQNSTSIQEVVTDIDSSESENSFEWDGESVSSLPEESNVNTSSKSYIESVWESNPLKKMGFSEGEATNRLAIMGLDWDNINANDIYIILSSFLYTSKTIQTEYSNSMIKKIAIYPSCFGKERMEYEQVNGPKIGDDRFSSEKMEAPNFSEEMTEEDYEAIRKYQVEKSLYYYAIVDCDSVDTAIKLYDELDGMEADFCIDCVEMRFVPDNITDFPYEAISTSTGVPPKYKQPECFTSALRHSRPILTWDDTPKERVKFLRRKFTQEELLKNDFDAYLGSSSSEVENVLNENNKDPSDSLTSTKLSNMRDLLLGDAKDIFNDQVEEGKNNESYEHNGILDYNINRLFDRNNNDHNEVEIEFNQDLENLSMDLISKGKQKWEDQMNIESESNKPLTPWQEYLKKRKQKKKERKMRLREKIKEQKLQREKSTNIKCLNTHYDSEGVQDIEFEDQSEDEDRHFDMKKIALAEKSHEKIKSKKRRELVARATLESIQTNFTGSINDPRISKVFTDSDFAIDPTNPTFKPTEFNKQLLFKKRLQKNKRNIYENKKKSKIENNNDFIDQENSFKLL